MTREEAIKEMIRAYEVLDFSCHMDNRRKEAFNMAKVALEQEPCEDAVSRQAVLKEIPVLWNSRGDKDYCMESLRDFVAELPPVTPTREASEWQQDHAILKAHSDGANEVIDRIKELRGDVSVLREERRTIECQCGCASDVADEVLELIDKLIAEVEG